MSFAWSCPKCTFHHRTPAPRCAMCGELRNATREQMRDFIAGKRRVDGAMANGGARGSGGARASVGGVRGGAGNGGSEKVLPESASPIRAIANPYLRSGGKNGGGPSATSISSGFGANQAASAYSQRSMTSPFSASNPYKQGRTKQANGVVDTGDTRRDGTVVAARDQAHGADLESRQRCSRTVSPCATGSFSGPLATHCDSVSGFRSARQEIQRHPQQLTQEQQPTLDSSQQQQEQSTSTITRFRRPGLPSNPYSKPQTAVILSSSGGERLILPLKAPNQALPFDWHGGEPCELSGGKCRPPERGTGAGAVGPSLNARKGSAELSPPPNNGSFNAGGGASSERVASTPLRGVVSASSHLICAPGSDPRTKATKGQYRPGPVAIDEERKRTWIYPLNENYPERGYQLAMSNSAIFDNTLISLPTGLGKTLIAAVVMYNYYRWFGPNGGKVIFCAPTRPLVTQQIEACYKIMGIPTSETAEISGRARPEYRAELWEGRKVFFCTPQSLQKDIDGGRCDARRIVCIVLDEAHKAKGDYAYVRVVKQIESAGAKFRVVGLSATPGTSIQSVQEVVNNLRISKIEVQSEEDESVRRFLHHRAVETVVVRLSPAVLTVERLFNNLVQPILDTLRSSGVLQYYGSGNPHLIWEAWNKYRESGNRGMEGLFVAAHKLVLIKSVLKDNGIGVVKAKLSRIREVNSGVLAKIVRKKEFQLLWDAVVQATDTGKSASQTSASDLKLNNPKMEKLDDILTEHFERAQAVGKSSRAIVFSQWRETVEQIVAMLGGSVTGLIRPKKFVGQSNGGGNDRGKLEDNGAAGDVPSVLVGMKQSEQQRVIEEFKAGDYNVLVCTVIGEEGLDIGEVDLIVNFDCLRSPTRMIQRTGRTGRMRDGRVVCLVAEGEEERKFAESQRASKTIGRALRETGRFKFTQSPKGPMFENPPVLLRQNMHIITGYRLSQVGGHSAKKKRTSARQSDALSSRRRSRGTVTDPDSWRLSASQEEDRRRRFGCLIGSDCIFGERRRRDGDGRIAAAESGAPLGFPLLLRRTYLKERSRGRSDGTKSRGRSNGIALSILRRVEDLYLGEVKAISPVRRRLYSLSTNDGSFGSNITQNIVSVPCDVLVDASSAAAGCSLSDGKDSDCNCAVLSITGDSSSKVARDDAQDSRSASAIERDANGSSESLADKPSVVVESDAIGTFWDPFGSVSLDGRSHERHKAFAFSLASIFESEQHRLAEIPPPPTLIDSSEGIYEFFSGDESACDGSTESKSRLDANDDVFSSGGDSVESWMVDPSHNVAFCTQDLCRRRIERRVRPPTSPARFGLVDDSGCGSSSPCRSQEREVDNIHNGSVQNSESMSSADTVRSVGKKKSCTASDAATQAEVQFRIEIASSSSSSSECDSDGSVGDDENEELAPTTIVCRNAIDKHVDDESHLLRDINRTEKYSQKDLIVRNEAETPTEFVVKNDLALPKPDISNGIEDQKNALNGSLGRNYSENHSVSSGVDRSGGSGRDAKHVVAIKQAEPICLQLPTQSSSSEEETEMDSDDEKEENLATKSGLELTLSGKPEDQHEPSENVVQNEAIKLGDDVFRPIHHQSDSCIEPNDVAKKNEFHLFKPTVARGVGTSRILPSRNSEPIGAMHRQQKFGVVPQNMATFYGEGFSDELSEESQLICETNACIEQQKVLTTQSSGDSQNHGHKGFRVNDEASNASLADTPEKSADVGVSRRQEGAVFEDESGFDDVVCDVCRCGASPDEDPIVLCDGYGGISCPVAVHRSCYGIDIILKDDEDWRCDSCQQKKNDRELRRSRAAPACFVCSQAGGALRKTDSESNQFVHPVCLFWHPCYVQTLLGSKKPLPDDGYSGDVVGQDVLRKVSPDMHTTAMTCCSCLSPNAVQCAAPGCKRAAHPYCAVRKRDMGWEVVHQKGKQFNETNKRNMESFSGFLTLPIWRLFCDAHRGRADSVNNISACHKCGYFRAKGLFITPCNSQTRRTDELEDTPSYGSYKVAAKMRRLQKQGTKKRSDHEAKPHGHHREPKKKRCTEQRSTGAKDQEKSLTCAKREALRKRVSLFFDNEAAIESEEDMDGDEGERYEIEAIEEEEELSDDSFINDSSQLGYTQDALDLVENDREDDNDEYDPNCAAIHRNLDNDKERGDEFMTPLLHRRIKDTSQDSTPHSATSSQKGLGRMHFIRSVIEHHKAGGDAEEIEKEYHRITKENGNSNTPESGDSIPAQRSPEPIVVRIDDT